ncbi:hypothetical protein [Saccharothrix sp.]|nr:hypothetical protein [Saccharothrix sp.]
MDGTGLTAEELVARHRELPRVGHDRMRREAEEFFAPDDDPCERSRG